MAKAGEFKNKITKAQEELFKALENEQTKRNSTSSKIIQELSKANKANVKTLNSLNKEYLETCNMFFFFRIKIITFFKFINFF